jgi:hypothetical protein
MSKVKTDLGTPAIVQLRQALIEICELWSPGGLMLKVTARPLPGSRYAERNAGKIEVHRELVRRR